MKHIYYVFTTYKFLISFCVKFIFCLSYSYCQVNLQNGLIACYPFSGNATDATGNGNNGTVTNGPTLVNDRFNNPNCAYEFDGVDDYISISPNNFKNPNYTYSLWANVKVLPSDGSNIAVWSIGNTNFSGAGDQFIMLGANYINSAQTGWYAGGYNTVGGTSLSAVGSLPVTNNWYHLAVTRDNSNVTFYVNGQLIGSESTGGSAPRYGGSNGAVEAGIGRRAPTLGGQYFKGIIDDFSMYNRALSQIEITALYNNSNCLTLPLPTTQNASSCGSGTLTLKASGGNQYRWYDAQIGGNLLFTGDSYITPFLNSSQTYYVCNFNGSVESERKAVIATILPIPVIPIANDVSRCGEGVVTLTASGGTSYRWYTDLISTSPINSTSTLTTSNLTNSTSYYVTNFNGTCESTRKAVNAIILPTPAKPSIIVDKSTNFCQGDSVILSAPTGFFAYQWSNGATTQSIKIKAGGSYTVYVKNNDNCNSPLSEPVIIVVNPIPASPITNDFSQCGSGSTTLTASGGTNYRWYNDLASTIPLSTSVTYTTPIITTTTTYYVSSFNGNCESPRKSITVNVSPQPQMPVIDDISRCGVGVVTLTATGGTSYRWYSDIASTIPIGYNPFFNTPILTQSTIYYVANFDGICESTRKAVHVNIVNPPQKPVIVANGPTIFCQGDTVVLTAPSGFSNYLWSNGASTQSIKVADSGNFSVSVKNVSTCESPYSDPVNIQIRSELPISVSIDGGNNKVCPEVPVIFKANVTNGGLTPLFQWKINGVNEGVPTASSILTYTFANTKQVYNAIISVEMTSSLSCAEPKTANSQYEVIVYPKLFAEAFILADDTICSGQEVILTAKTLNAGINPLYQWKVDGKQQGPPSNSDVFKLDTINNRKEPIYIKVDVELLSNLPCTPPAVASLILTVYPQPELSCIIPDIVETQSRYLYKVEVMKGLAPYLFIWDFGNGDIITSHKDTISYIYNQKGVYNVTVKMVDSIGCETLCTTGVKAKPPINIPPNVFTPNGDAANEKFTINYEGDGNFEMTIYNRWGKAIATLHNGMQGWDGAGCPTGVYFYRIKVEDKEFKGWVSLLR